MSLLRRRMMMQRQAEEDEDMKYFEIIDDISLEEEVEEIPLAVDFMDAKEVFVFISIPAHGLGNTKNYYFTTKDEYTDKNVGWLSAYTNVATGSEVHYIALERGKGRFTAATGMQDANLDAPNYQGGTANAIVLKSPRIVGNNAKLIGADGFAFPVGTRIITYRR